MQMKKRKKSKFLEKKEFNSKLNVADILLRYFILLIVAIPGLWLFYFVFTILTVYPVYWILNIFFDAFLVFDINFLSKTVIWINDFLPIELIPACIAGSAYYLLLVLNLATPEIKIKTRISAIFFSLFAFLILNVLRIVFLSVLAITDSPYFDVTHKIFWYSLSTLFVVGIWFVEVKKFKIKEIPFYSDLKSLFELTSRKKK